MIGYYEAPPFRPPTEAYSLLIRATRNCSWNRCEFCCMYKGTKLEIRPVEEVKQDILSAKKVAQQIKEWAWRIGDGNQVGMVARANGILWLDEGVVKNVFIGDSNSIIMKTEDFAEIISFLYETFPTLERVTSYGRGKTLVKKSPEELRMLREAGLTRLHVGLETGDEELLEYVKKGATAEEMIIGGRKAIEAGFELSEYVMPGLGGRERWEQHAHGTARVLNEINPHFIRLRTLGLIPGTPLYEKNQRGEFQLQSLEELLIEVRTLIERLTVTSEFVTSDHVANHYMWGVDGKLPQDKARMLETIDAMLERVLCKSGFE
ncbi:MAG: radical SAM protein [Dehalococcoidia bacterium]|nr:radical SAM protein [Dehalococcoidia bacterium]